MTYRFKFRRGSAAEWASDNPRLFAGEPGVELDTGYFKIGDGVRAWNDLSYYMDASGVEQALEDAIDEINAEGIAGDSAYEVAVKNGFVGTEEEWLESLKGEPGDPGADSTIPGPPGGDSTVPGPPGDSAYEVAVSEGFSGTEAEWLDSLTGEDGVDGVNGLYDSWQHTHGITDPSWGVVSCGSEAPIDSEMLYFNVNSQRGQDFTGLFKLIDIGSTVSCQSTLNVDSWIVYEITGEITFDSGVAAMPVVAIDSGSVGATGWETVTVLFTKAAQPGPKGDSAYEIAVSEGFPGTESEWLDSLKGEPGDPGSDSTVPGPPGDSAYEIAVSEGFVGTESEWLDSLKGAPGDPGTTEWSEIDNAPDLIPVIESSPIKPTGRWIGSEAQYNALGSYDPDVIYDVTE